MPWPRTAARRRRTAKSRRQLRKRPLDLPRLVRLEDVAFPDVLVVGQDDAALVAGGDLAHVRVKALERGDRGVVDDGAVADDAVLGAARKAPVGDVATVD